MGRIDLLMKRAGDYTFPAGQAQAGLQLAMVEVPWLLARIAELEAAEPVKNVA